MVAVEVGEGRDREKTERRFHLFLKTELQRGEDPTKAVRKKKKSLQRFFRITGKKKKEGGQGLDSKKKGERRNRVGGGGRGKTRKFAYRLETEGLKLGVGSTRL